jgi:hypothetical protein
MVKMITPSFGLTATERVLPRMALDFTTAILDSRVTFARTGDTATVTNSSGVIAAINANLPRFDFNPTTLVCRGLLIEEARTNLLLNSLIDGTSLSTQLVTTTAVSQTLSFYGTGQIVLTGTSSATVVGTGAYPARTTLTFTPTAGALTLTVSGTVQYAQLETGAFATSFIPTDGTTKTRNADLASMTGTNFSDWYNASEGSFVVQANVPTLSANQCLLGINDGTTSNRIRVLMVSATALRFSSITSSVEDGSLTKTIANGANDFSIAYKLNNNAFSTNGTATSTDTSVAVPPVNKLDIGSQLGTSLISGYIQKIMYYPQRLINAEVQAFSK